MVSFRATLCAASGEGGNVFKLSFQSRPLGRFVLASLVSTSVMIYCFPQCSQSLHYLTVCH